MKPPLLIKMISNNLNSFSLNVCQPSRTRLGGELLACSRSAGWRRRAGRKRGYNK